MPWGTSRVLREDVKNPRLLYLGTETAIYYSLDEGKTWNGLNNTGSKAASLPTVAIHEIAVHPTAGEIVVATHGRSLWILDVSALQQTNLKTIEHTPSLHQPTSVIRWQSKPSRGRTNRRFVGQNPYRGATISYSLPKQAEKVTLEVFDVNGKRLRQLRAATTQGLHAAQWDLRASSRRPGGRQPGGRRPPIRRGGSTVGAGNYRVVLTVDGKEFSQVLKVEDDPNLPPDVRAAQQGTGTVQDQETEEKEEEEHSIDD